MNKYLNTSLEVGEIVTIFRENNSHNCIINEIKDDQYNITDIDTKKKYKNIERNEIVRPIRAVRNMKYEFLYFEEHQMFYYYNNDDRIE